jgi:hypothetical protein
MQVAVMKDVKATISQQMKAVGIDDVEQLQDDMADLYVRGPALRALHTPQPLHRSSRLQHEQCRCRAVRTCTVTVPHRACRANCAAYSKP